MNKVNATLFALLFILLSSFLLFPTIFEQHDPHEHPWSCGFDHYKRDVFDKNPAFRLRQAELEAEWRRYQLGSIDIVPRASYTIPVVVHVVHQNGLENISDARVEESIRLLNDAFANRGYYDPSEGVDVDVEFCLARRDPNNISTTGITRWESSLSGVVYEDDAPLKNLVNWPSDCYVNIWVVGEIESISSGAGVAGYATFPGAHGSTTDGIVIEARWLGTDEGSNSILVHEMGHFLGLYHTFEGGCKNDDCTEDGDRVCDTPPDQSTAPIACSNPVNTCDTDDQSGLSSDLNDMHNNYMDYGDFNCYNAFTQGQKERMLFFLTNARSSFFDCNSCLDPCPDDVSAVIDLGAMQPLGEAVSIQAITDGIVSYEWFLDGQPISQDAVFSYIFPAEGEYVLRLEATGNSPNCKVYQEMVVQVSCPVVADFQSGYTDCLTPGQSLTFSSSSQNAQSFEWYFDDVLVGSGTSYIHTFAQGGRFRVRLKAVGRNCEAFSSVLTVYVGCNEICGNGIDDDQDGYIDCFDSDCCESCLDHYFFNCEEGCPPSKFANQSDLQVEWRYEGIHWDMGTSPVVADIDQDGFPEIIGHDTRLNNATSVRSFTVLDGRTGEIKFRFPVQGVYPRYSAPAVADVDGDGMAELFLVGRANPSSSRHAKIFCYKFNGTTFTETWASDERNGYHEFHALVNPSIADFNGDGRPEVYTYNRIFDSFTGRMLAEGGPTNNRGYIDYAIHQNGTIAADVLPDDHCPNCDGLELVAGDQVFAVNVVDGTMTVVQDGADDWDGYTGIADFDLDGDPDAFIGSADGQGSKYIVWDIQTDEYLTTTYRPPVQGYPKFNVIPAVGDVHGDARPELIATTKSVGFGENAVRVLQWNNGQWDQVYKNLTDDFSGMAGCSLFDIDGNGKAEILYRDHSTFRVIDVERETHLIELSCQSETYWEYPTVADADGDGETEILCSCDEQLMSLSSRANRWMKSRPVWNQYQYHATNINDDLTVPTEPQRTYLEQVLDLNAHLRQYAIPEPPRPDATITFENVDCDVDAFQLRMEICNQGALTLPAGTPLTLYDNDPTTTNPGIFWQTILNDPLAIDSCIQLLYVAPHTGFQGRIHAVIGDPGTTTKPYDLATDFPLTATAECDYFNNISVYNLQNLYPDLDLGPDQEICENGIFTFDAGAGWDRYTWQDGSNDQTFTAAGPGIYWVEVEGACGFIFSDTVRVILDPAKTLDLGEDLFVCQGEEIRIDLSGFDTYQWEPPLYLSCATCASVVIKPEQEITYIVTAQSDLGCVSVDTLKIGMGRVNISEELSICQGDTIERYGQKFFEAGTFTFTWQLDNCETDVTMNVLTFDAFRTAETIEICQGEVAFLFGQAETEAGLYEATFQTVSGCDSIHEITLLLRDTFYEEQMIELCEDVSIPLFDKQIDGPGLYEFVYTNQQGCDSTYQVWVESLDSVLIETTERLCFGDSIEIFGELTSEPGTYINVLTNTAGCDSTVIINVEVNGELDIDILADSLLRSGAWTDLAAVVSGASGELSYEWTLEGDGAISCENCPVASVYAEGTTWIQLQVSDSEGCTRSIKKQFQAFSTDIYIPTAFSPNGDGINERFTVYGPSGIEVVRLSIFNRWGALVFSNDAFPLSDEVAGWDGSFKGRLLNSGVYVYQAEVQFPDGSRQLLSGDLTLLR
ncbi:MAG: M43 family zinc metalloprotease [Bacteroidota bacterium]